MSRKGGKTSKKKKEKGQRIGRKREETVTISMRSGSASENEKEGQKNIFYERRNHNMLYSKA